MSAGKYLDRISAKRKPFDRSLSDKRTVHQTKVAGTLTVALQMFPYSAHLPCRAAVAIQIAAYYHAKEDSLLSIMVPGICRG